MLPHVDPTQSWKPLPLPKAEMRALSTLRVLAAGMATVFFSIACVLATLVFQGDRVVSSVMRLWGRVVLFFLGVRLVVTNRAALDRIGQRENQAGPYVLLANHQSLLDGLVLISLIRHPTAWVLKREFGRFPIFGMAIRRTRQILVDREDRAKAKESVGEIVHRLQQGSCAVVFPEGKRYPYGTLGPFKKGIVHVALKARVPILPLSLVETGARLPANSLSLCPGTVHVIVGEPIETTEWQEETLDTHLEQIRRAIAEPLSQHREHVRVGAEGRSLRLVTPAPQPRHR